MTSVVVTSDLAQEFPNRQNEDLKDITASPGNHGDSSLIGHKEGPDAHSPQVSVDSTVSSNKKNTPTGISEFRCALCHKSFAGRGSLSNHIVTHTGERQFKCEHCNKKFTRKDHLQCHIRIHTGQKPFKCPVCEKAFATASHKKVHIRNHTGERPYKCDMCEKHFICSSGLKNHMFSHTGDRPFKCTICKRRYKSHYLLQLHMKRCHEMLCNNSEDDTVMQESKQSDHHIESEELSIPNCAQGVKANHLPPIPPLTPLTAVVQSMVAACKKDNYHCLTSEGEATEKLTCKDMFPLITNLVKKLSDSHPSTTDHIDADTQTMCTVSALSGNRNGITVCGNSSIHGQNQVELKEEAGDVSCSVGLGYSTKAQTEIGIPQECDQADHGNNNIAKSSVRAGSLQNHNKRPENPMEHRDMPTLMFVSSSERNGVNCYMPSTFHSREYNSDQQLIKPVIPKFEVPCEHNTFSCPECKSQFVSMENLASHRWICLKAVTDRMALSLKSHKSKSLMHATSNGCNEAISPEEILPSKRPSNLLPLVPNKEGPQSKNSSEYFDSEKIAASNKKLSCNTTSSNEHSPELPTKTDKKNKNYNIKDGHLQCKVCNKAFHCLSKLKIHKVVHSELRPFTCNVCHKSFKGRGSLHNHMIGHSGLRPFQCNQCGRTFTRKEHLNIHMRLHTGDKPFSCEFCEKRFATASHRKVHLRIHTGERPFHCNMCEMGFMTSTMLKQHQKRDHIGFSLLDMTH